jgi:hypothetical protein
MPGLLLAIVLLTIPAYAQSLSQEHRYRERRGATHSFFTLRLEHGEGAVLTASGDGETFTTHLAADFSTRRWEVVRAAEGTEITVERKTDELHLSGRLRGEPVRRVLRIDESPWYQALSVSLRPFLAGGAESVEFWMLRPDTLEPVRLRGVKQGEEKVTAAGRTLPALLVEVHPPGLAAMVWRGRYWFRRRDGLFLRFEAPGGLPGSPLTVVELTE